MSRNVVSYQLIRYLCLCGALLAAEPLHAALPAISANQSHGVALNVDGTVRAWGSDLYGELGIGRTFVSTTAAPVVGFGGVRAVSAGYLHTMALKSDGTVWGWGANSGGWLGDGTTTSRSTPSQTLNLLDAIAVSTGQNSTGVLRRDGTVWMVGTSGPLPVAGIAGATALSLGYSGQMALRNDGTVWTWGLNYFGQLGDGTNVNRFTPGPVAGLAGVIAISAGGSHNLTLKGDGTVWGWGGNNGGALGDGSTTNRSAPVPVSGLTGIVGISAGKGGGLTSSPEHSIALKGDGTVWAWGGNTNGQLGDGSTSARLTPVSVAALTGVSAISAGGSHTLALKADGTVWAWGSNAYAQLGDGTTTDRSTPVQVAGLNGVVAISAGGNHSVAVKADGSVVAWGYNNIGQLGNSANVNRTVPARVGVVSNVVAVAAGDYHTLALRSDETVLAWGSNYGGQLGDGSFVTERSTPMPVPGLTSVVGIAASYNRSVAVKKDGSVWTWGYSNRGQLGNGSYNGSNVPIPLGGLTNIVSVSAGFFHSLALRSDGTVWSWGDNSSGELGDGTTATRLTPAMIGGLAGVIAVGAGNGHSVAVKADGTVWQWGRGSQRVPSQVPGLNDIVSVAAGYFHTVAIRRDASVVQWSPGASPAAVKGLTDVVSVSAGANFSLALKRDGTVYSWGDNNLGQLGDGTLATRQAPVVVLREEGGGTVPANDWFLDLNPAIRKTIPSDKIPVFLVVAGAQATDVTARIQFNPADVGKQGSVFVFALAPAALVKNGLVATSEGGAKDAPLPCVLAQLTASGQLTAVSASNLQAYLTDVLGAQGASVKVLDGVSASLLQGAVFYVGYGTNSTGMLNGGTNRSVLTVPGTTTCQPQAPQTGWWWNPAEGGRGFSLEVQGSNLFFSSYLYDATGRATWYAAIGRTSLDGTLFNGRLLSFASGQTLDGAYRAPDPATDSGAITLAFNDATHGTLIWPGGTRSIQRFDIASPGASATAALAPENGWWWSSSEGGRGYFIEFSHDAAFIAGYMYDATGKPVWYLTSGTVANPLSYQGSWVQYGNGQTLTGAYRPASVINGNVGSVRIQFQNSSSATLTLPGGRQVPITRFGF